MQIVAEPIQVKFSCKAIEKPVSPDIDERMKYTLL